MRDSRYFEEKKILCMICDISKEKVDLLSLGGGGMWSYGENIIDFFHVSDHFEQFRVFVRVCVTVINLTDEGYPPSVCGKFHDFFSFFFEYFPNVIKLGLYWSWGYHPIL